MNSRDDLTLRSAQIKWVEGVNNNQWDICDNKNNSLFLLPNCMTKHEVASLLPFIQEYEMKAFNEGMEQGKQAAMAAGTLRMKEMINHITVLEHDNEDLAHKLEVIIEREID